VAVRRIFVLDGSTLCSFSAACGFFRRFHVGGL
jgi:hypothetical protein